MSTQHPDVTAAQLETASIALRRARRRHGARPREQRALVAAGLVESNLSQISYGDRDSQGFLQQRPSQGWGPYRPGRAGIRQDTDDFMARAKQYRGQKMTAGQLAQAVQRSAFPGRYGERMGQARQIIGQAGGNVRLGGATQTSVKLGTKTIPGQSFETERDAAKRELLLSGDLSMGKLLEYKGTVNQLQDVPARKVAGDLQVKRTKGPGVSVPTRGGGKVAGKGGIHEVFYDPMGRYYDSGKIVKGAIGGHGTHVHVAASPELADELGFLAERMGLSVRENETFDPVERVHTDGSFHYKDMAIDVSGGTPAQLRKFARLAMREARRRGGKR